MTTMCANFAMNLLLMFFQVLGRGLNFRFAYVDVLHIM